MHQTVTISNVNGVNWKFSNPKKLLIYFNSSNKFPKTISLKCKGPCFLARKSWLHIYRTPSPNIKLVWQCFVWIKYQQNLRSIWISVLAPLLENEVSSEETLVSLDLVIFLRCCTAMPDDFGTSGALTNYILSHVQGMLGIITNLCYARQ